MSLMNRKTYRRKRHAHIRRRVAGTAERPRMAIMVSNRAMYVQFVDDEKAVTLAAASSDAKQGNNIEAARALGQRAAEAAAAKGIKQVVVDRGGFKYHGRVKTLVETAIESGLQSGAWSAAPAGDKEEK